MTQVGLSHHVKIKKQLIEDERPFREPRRPCVAKWEGDGWVVISLELYIFTRSQAQDFERIRLLQFCDYPNLRADLKDWSVGNSCERPISKNHWESIVKQVKNSCKVERCINQTFTPKSFRSDSNEAWQLQIQIVRVMVQASKKVALVFVTTLSFNGLECRF